MPKATTYDMKEPHSELVSTLQCEKTNTLILDLEKSKQQDQ